MIAVAAGLRVLVASKPVDFRKGADGLAALVREALGEDPFSGTIFVFRCKRADRVKILAWDGSGLVLFWKRLEHGAFRWPPISDGMMRLTASQLAALVDGMDWSRLHARDVGRDGPACRRLQLRSGSRRGPRPQAARALSRHRAMRRICRLQEHCRRSMRRGDHARFLLGPPATQVLRYRQGRLRSDRKRSPR